MSVQHDGGLVEFVQHGRGRHGSRGGAIVFALDFRSKGYFLTEFYFSWRLNEIVRHKYRQGALDLGSRVETIGGIYAGEWGRN